MEVLDDQWLLYSNAAKEPMRFEEKLWAGGRSVVP
jgi:hypothetical protein